MYMYLAGHSTERRTLLTFPLISKNGLFAFQPKANLTLARLR